jgi:hypothetical protein
MGMRFNAMMKGWSLHTHLVGLAAMILALALGGRVMQAATYDEAEIVVRSSPMMARAAALTDAETVLAFAVSPFGDEIFIVVHDGETDGYRMRVWSLRAGMDAQDWSLPPGITPRGIVVHPAKRQLFLAAQHGTDSIVLRVEAYHGRWQATPIFRTPAPILNLLAGPRPFLTHWTPESGFEREFRLFFAVQHADGALAINSITENGVRAYQVLGPQAHYIRFPEETTYEQPTPMLTDWAMPQAIHPAGDLLVWQDREGCFHGARYDAFNWSGTTPLWAAARCGGSLRITPNGLGVMHWQPDQPGVTVYVNRGQTAMPRAQTVQFAAMPELTADGKGIIGLAQTEAGLVLRYTPVDLPLADVVNAWMFVQSDHDATLFAEHSGLWRSLDAYEQLYQLYEAESYYPSFPHVATRPYLATTDIFWEVFAAAYRGLFLLAEEFQAMPAFRACLDALRAHYQATHPDSPWNAVFLTLNGLWEPEQLPPDLAAEVARIHQADGVAVSTVLQRSVDFGELQPRGHYTQSPAWATYFKAVMYLTRLAAENQAWLRELTALPPEITSAALAWLRAYEPFIAPSRRPTVWQEGAFAPPAYHRHPRQELGLFPLAWGFDNEALFAVVFHEDWPPEEQIIGPRGPRLLPSALDLAAALGNPLALTLLADDLADYPQLQPALERLQARFRHAADAEPTTDNLYERWLQALAVQWAAEAASPDNMSGHQPLWAAKRLQTGLASWTTLRHAAVLVSERGAAEAGEGGFETLIMPPPRGYVEPDPDTFEAIASLFDATIRLLATTLTPPDEFGLGVREPLRQGILRRLSDSAATARLFRDIAAKELRGDPLTPAEYAAILHVGRVAEHHFLVYHSLANARHQFALSTPDPLPKVVDVFGGQPEGVPFLLSAVGRPLEWNQIVPYYGRRAIVRGAVYAYYEFTSPTLLDDDQWLERLPTQPRPTWVTPYLSAQQLPWLADSLTAIGGP